MPLPPTNSCCLIAATAQLWLQLLAVFAQRMVAVVVAATVVCSIDIAYGEIPRVKYVFITFQLHSPSLTGDMTC